MRFRIAIVTAVLVTLGSSADATILNIVSCETGKPIPGVQKRAGGGGQESENIRYEVSAPGFVQRAFNVEVDTVNEACLEPAPAQSEQRGQTTAGAQQHEGQGRGGNEHAGGRDGGGSHSDGRDLLRLPGPSADERARRHLETNELPPAPWVDTGPEENVEGQIGSMGRLLKSKEAPPQTRTRVATPDPSTAAPTESDATPELVPDDTGLYWAEEVADAMCRPSDTTAGANEKNDQWGTTYCSDFNSFKARKRSRQQAKQQGLDPDKTHPYTSAQQMMKTMIEDGANNAVKAAQASCAKKITCAVVACTTQCDVSFQKLVETASCKRKRNKRRKTKKGKGRPVMMDRLRVKVIGNCGCTCAPKAACGGIEAAM